MLTGTVCGVVIMLLWSILLMWMDLVGLFRVGLMLMSIRGLKAAGELG